MRKRGLRCRSVSVCPSVTLVDYIHATEDIVKLLIQPGSPITLDFHPNAGTQFQGNPSPGAQKDTGWENFAIFDFRFSLYLGNAYKIGP